MKPLRYDDWLESLFNQTGSHNGPHLLHEELWHTSSQLAGLVVWMLEHCGSDLIQFTNEQIALGLECLFGGCALESSLALKSGEVPRAQKLRLLRSFQILYAECFEKRCAPVLRHANEPGGDSLNSFCYMLWDTSYLAYWDDHRDPEEFYSVLVEMLKGVLLLSNPACIESALHGLGHLHSYSPEAVELAVTAFMDRAKGDDSLLQYAKQASMGDVL